MTSRTWRVCADQDVGVVNKCAMHGRRFIIDSYTETTKCLNRGSNLPPTGRIPLGQQPRGKINMDLTGQVAHCKVASMSGS